MRNYGIYLLQILLGSIFIFSAVSKMFSIGVFEISVLEQGLIRSRDWTALLARVLIGFELFLGVALFIRSGLKKITLPFTLLTLTGFTVYLLYFAVFRPEMKDCGCFGEYLPMTPFESILKNIVLFILAALLYRLAPEQKFQWKIHAAVFSLAIVLVFIFVPLRSPKSTQFSKYTQFHLAGIVDLHSGKKLVAVFNVDCEHCLQTAFELGLLYKEDSRLPAFYCLMAGDSTKIDDFFRKAQIRFPYRMISDEEFFNLIGNQPPRVYHLIDGEIRDIWDDRFTYHLRQIYPE